MRFLGSKFFFVLIAAFWVAMNVLLWRSQSARSQVGSAIPPSVVWDKILTAPDSSSLDIYDHDKKIGFCQCSATVGGAGQVMKQSLTEDYAPEGIIPAPTGYSLSLDGNTSIFGTNRMRFGLHILLSTNQTWQDVRLTAKMRPMGRDVHASEASGKVVIKVDGEDGNWQRTIDLTDLQHPDSLLAELGGIDVPSAFLMQKGMITQAAASIQWDAHEDWMQFGHSKVQVYRLETTFLGQHLYIFTSRAGEILWVEGPNKLTLRNEAFSHF